MVVVTVGLFACIHLWDESAVRRAEADLEEAIAEINALEPGGWRLADLEKQREKVPDRENGSKLIVEAAKLLPKQWQEDAIFNEIQDVPPPWRLTVKQAGALRAELAKLEPALKVAHQLVGYPRGRFPPLRLGPDHFTYANPHAGNVRDLALVLYCDAIALAEQGDTTNGWDSALAALHAGRTIGDEPALVSQLTRMTARGFAVEAMERVLGRGAVGAVNLARARDLLVEEMRVYLLPIAIRGERAAQHDFYSRIARGELRLEDVIRPTAGDLKDVEPLVRTDEKIRRAIIAGGAMARRQNLAGSHAYTLRALTRALECTIRREADRKECLTGWEMRIKDDQARQRAPLLASILNPALWKFAAAEEKRITLTRCAVVALAGEQFRLKQMRWPKDLAELVAAGFLAQAPLDPFDGQPLRLRHTPDGLVVYSVGWSKQYAGNAWDDLTREPFARDQEFRERVEFRLWNPDRRAQRPVPPRDAENP
jgi:hypothetical protein